MAQVNDVILIVGLITLIGVGIFMLNRLDRYVTQAEFKMALDRIEGVHESLHALRNLVMRNGRARSYDEERAEREANRAKTPEEPK